MRSQTSQRFLEENFSGRHDDAINTMQTKLIRSAMVLTLICTLTTGAAADTASDAALRRKVLGYWKTGRHAYLFKSDGIRYMVGGTPTRHWDIRGGVYYEDGKPYKISKLNEKEFDIAGGDLLERCSEKHIEQYKASFPDWMKEHQ